jgi:GT2 family glycosyltransferase
MAVAVVNYNTRDLLRGVVSSAIADGNPHVIVADNGSTDGSVEMLRAEFPAVDVIVDASNPGYGPASNAAISRAGAEYVLLLNSDIVVRPGTLSALTEYLDAHPKAAIAGPRLLNRDGTLQRSCHEFPTPLVSLLEHSWVGDLVRASGMFRRRLAHLAPHDRPGPVPWVTGAALAIRRTAFDSVGGFDPAYFMYFEEVDLAYRLHAAGWETHFAPAVEMVHFGGESTGQFRSAMFDAYYAAALQFYRRHRTPAETRQAARAFRFAMRSKMAIGAIRKPFASTPEQRAAIASHIADCRRTIERLRDGAPVRS